MEIGALGVSGAPVRLRVRVEPKLELVCATTLCLSTMAMIVPSIARRQQKSSVAIQKFVVCFSNLSLIKLVIVM